MNPPNPMSRWMSQVAGQEVVVPFPETVDDLLVDRPRNRFLHLNVDLPDLARFEEKVVVARRDSGDDLTAEISVPPGEGPFGVLIFLHGGAFYRGSAEDERKLAMQIAAGGLVVVNLDYRHAPEDPFPAALDDIAGAVEWVSTEIANYGGDPGRLAIGGASAGANLAAASVHRAAAAGADPFAALLLLYGFFDVAPLAAMGPSPILEAYLGPDYEDRMADPLVSPVHGDFAGFPPTYLTCGDEDVVLPASLDLTARLTQAGVPTTLSVVAGADHVFLNIPDVIPGSAAELERINAWLVQTLAVGEPAGAGGGG